MAQLQAGRDDMKSNQRERWGTLPDCFTFFHSGQAACTRAAAVCKVSGCLNCSTAHDVTGLGMLSEEGVGQQSSRGRCTCLTVVCCCHVPCSCPQMAKSAAVVVKPTKKERMDR